MKLMKRLLFHDCFVNQLSIEAEVGHFGACHSFLRGGERGAERHHGKRQHAFKRHYAKRHYAKSHYTKRHYAKTQHAKKQQALRLNDKNSKEGLIFHMMALSINSAPAR